MTGAIVYRPSEGQQHECKPPMHCGVYAPPPERTEGWAPRFLRWQPCDGVHNSHNHCPDQEAAEPLGTVWRCGECGRHWIVYLPENHPQSRIVVAYQPVWRPATWLECRRARRAARAER